MTTLEMATLAAQRGGGKLVLSEGSYQVRVTIAGTEIIVFENSDVFVVLGWLLRKGFRP